MISLLNIALLPQFDSETAHLFECCLKVDSFRMFVHNIGTMFYKLSKKMLWQHLTTLFLQHKSIILSQCCGNFNVKELHWNCRFNSNILSRNEASTVTMLAIIDLNLLCCYIETSQWPLALHNILASIKVQIKCLQLPRNYCQVFETTVFAFWQELFTYGRNVHEWLKYVKFPVRCPGPFNIILLSDLQSQLEEYLRKSFKLLPMSIE